jgi:hypothetical protein
VSFEPLQHKKKAGLYSFTKNNNVFRRTRAPRLEPGDGKQTPPPKGVGIFGTLLIIVFIACFVNLPPLNLLDWSPEAPHEG